MSIRLIRESSDTPNITNRDDTKMIRYAYGGYNGFVKHYGTEIGYTSSAGIFKITDGRIVLQGWEIEVDGVGWSIDVSNVSGTQYHCVYLEIDIAVETAQIKSTYLPGAVPKITSGDDLTHVPLGTARLPLYSFKVNDGYISEINRLVQAVPYSESTVKDIKNRLDILEHKTKSDIGKINWIVSTNTTKEYVNYILKQGQIAFCYNTLTFVSPLTLDNEDSYWGTYSLYGNTYNGWKIASISSNVRPTFDMKIATKITVEAWVLSGEPGESAQRKTILIPLDVLKDGSVWIAHRTVDSVYSIISVMSMSFGFLCKND